MESSKVSPNKTVCNREAAFERSAAPERTVIAISVAGVAILVLLWRLGFFGYDVPAAAIVLIATSNLVLLRIRFLLEKSVQNVVALNLRRQNFASLLRATENDLEAGVAPGRTIA